MLLIYSVIFIFSSFGPRGRASKRPVVHGDGPEGFVLALGLIKKIISRIGGAITRRG